ncbi:MAG: phosphoribosyl-AMP cyclohydrolase [Pseudomonadota bacterium]
MDPDTDAPWLDAVAFDTDGLVPVIAQDHDSGRVLMMAWANREALARTRALGEAVYWSRSRGRFWHKGESSGQTQTVHAIRLDCDGDVVLLDVTQAGAAACHTGRESCFYRELRDGEWVVTDDVLIDPETLYGGAR